MCILAGVFYCFKDFSMYDRHSVKMNVTYDHLCVLKKAAVGPRVSCGVVSVPAAVSSGGGPQQEC